jgi:hypothetical protein
MCGLDTELAQLLKQVGLDLTDDSYSRFWKILGVVDPFEPVPFEIWLGLAHALADTSGYRVVLQAAIMEPIEGQPKTFRTAGWKDVASLEPALFLETT